MTRASSPISSPNWVWSPQIFQEWLEGTRTQILNAVRRLNPNVNLSTLFDLQLAKVPTSSAEKRCDRIRFLDHYCRRVVSFNFFNSIIVRNIVSKEQLYSKIRSLGWFSKQFWFGSPSVYLGRLSVTHDFTTNWPFCWLVKNAYSVMTSSCLIM